jgi:hypothetical protein
MDKTKMNTQLQTQNNNHRIVKEKYVTHTLKEIPKLIRDNLYGIKRNWQVIGELLMEAKFLFEEDGKSERQIASDFWEWFENQGFNFSRSTGDKNMQAVAKFLKLKATERRTLRPSVTGTLYPDYQHPKEEIEAKVRKSVEMSRRMLEQGALRRDEEDLVRKLALQIVDIGFKTLSSRFHPDRKGGSHDAMRRLNEARRLLKSYLG